MLWPGSIAVSAAKWFLVVSMSPYLPPHAHSVRWEQVFWFICWCRRCYCFYLLPFMGSPQYRTQAHIFVFVALLLQPILLLLPQLLQLLFFCCTFWNLFACVNLWFVMVFAWKQSLCVSVWEKHLLQATNWRFKVKQTILSALKSKRRCHQMADDRPVAFKWTAVTEGETEYVFGIRQSCAGTWKLWLRDDSESMLCSSWVFDCIPSSIKFCRCTWSIDSDEFVSWMHSVAFNIQKKNFSLKHGFDSNGVADAASVYLRNYFSFIRKKPWPHQQFSNETIKRKSSCGKNRKLKNTNNYITSVPRHWVHWAPLSKNSFANKTKCLECNYPELSLFWLPSKSISSSISSPK